MKNVNLNIINLIVFLYSVFLLFFFLFFENNWGIKIFLLLQITLIVIAYIYKKLNIIFYIYIFLFFIEFVLIKKNIILLKQINIPKNIVTFKASSPILYLYTNKYQPLEIYKKPQKIIPLANVANNYIYIGNYNNKPIIIKTDNFGFFNNEKKKKFTNIFIGDSFIAGAEIDYKNNFVDLLKQEYKIYNLSLANSGPITQYAIMKEYINLSYLTKVKNVFWFYSEENDVARPYIDIENKGGDINIENSLTLLNKYLIYEHYKQDLIKKNLTLQIEFKKKIKKKYGTNESDYFLIPLFRYTKSILSSKNKIDNKLIRTYDENKEFYEKNLDLYFNVIDKMNLLLKKNKKKLTIVIVPNKFNCLINEEHFLNSKIKKKLEEKNIDYLDLNNVFYIKNKCNIKYFNETGHFSKEGHLIVEKFLNKKLKNE